jgi:hypothetical protein
MISDLSSRLSSIEHNLDQPILITWVMLNLPGIPRISIGERPNIIRSQKVPLTSLLWIAGLPHRSERLDTPWRHITLHTLNTPKQIASNGVVDLVRVFGYITAFYATCLSVSLYIDEQVESRATKPYRFFDYTFLTTLSNPPYRAGRPGSACFTESACQIQGGFPLDAVVELFAPLVGTNAWPSTDFVSFRCDSVKRKRYLEHVQV